MKAFSAEMLAALTAGELPLVTMVRLAFPSATMGLNSSMYSFSYAGTLYQGAAVGGYGAIGAITDGASDPGGVQFEFAGFDVSLLGIALGDQTEVQGAPIEIRTGIFTKDTHQLIDAPLDWAGYADTMKTKEEGDTGRVTLTAENKAVDLLREHPLVYDDPDQQALYPGDRGCEYVVSQADKPVVWPAKEFFHK